MSRIFVRRITCRAMVYADYGAPLQVLKCYDYPLPPPEADQFLVRFLAAPINPADLNQIEGVYPTRPTFTSLGGEKLAVGGNEGVVEVIQAGKDALSMKWNPGQWGIMTRPGIGTWRSHALLKRDDFMCLEDGLSPTQLATVSVNPCTAYQLLRMVDLSEGEWIIQNGANSAVGKSVVQIARIRGIRTMNVIRDREGTDAVREELLALGADIVLLDTELDSKETQSLIKEKQIRLALNCVGGKRTQSMIKSLSHGALIATYGAMARQPLTMGASHLIFKDYTFKGFWITPWNAAHPEERIEMLNDLVRWTRDGKFKFPTVDVNTWTPEQTLEEAEAVFKRAMEDTSKKQVVVMQY